MGLGKLLTRNLTYDVTDSVTGETAAYTLITDGGPGMYAGWGDGPYRGGMGIPAAWRLALMIANQLGRVPWHSFRDVAGRPPVQLPPAPLLTNPVGTTDTGLSVFRSWGLDRLWHGNAIGVIAQRSPLGYPTAAIPVSAEAIQVERFGIAQPYSVGTTFVPPGFERGEIGYLINGAWWHARDIIHFKGPCKPGELRGMGVLEAHFDAMARSRALDRSATDVDGSAVPTGLLKSLNPDLSKTEAQELKDSWKASQRSRTVAVLNPLTDFTPIAWNPTETQLLESRQYGLVEWANIFGVNVSFANGQNASRVYSNIEDMGLDLLKFGQVGDIIAEFEAVLTNLMPRGQYVKANLDHLLRADTKTRYEAHSMAIASGFLTRDEVRELEERPPLTPEQKVELAALAAPAPPGNNTAGAGAAPPRLAAVRAAMEAELAELEEAELAERAGHDQPRWPRGSGDKSGEWSGAGGGAGSGRAPGGGAIYRPGGSDGSVFFSGQGGAQRLPGAGGRLGTGTKAVVRPPRTATIAPVTSSPLAKKPKSAAEAGATAARLGVEAPAPGIAKSWSARQWGAYWESAQAGTDRLVAQEVANAHARAELPELPEAGPPEFEPGYDDAGDDPGRDWFIGEAEAWAADDVSGGPWERARAGEEALHRYWTAGPGLARWRGSPTPWRTLRGFLSKYLSGENLDATTSAWYRDVFGHLPVMTKGGRGPKRRRT